MALGGKTWNEEKKKEKRESLSKLMNYSWEKRLGSSEPSEPYEPNEPRAFFFSSPSKQTGKWRRRKCLENERKWTKKKKFLLFWFWLGSVRLIFDLDSLSTNDELWIGRFCSPAVKVRCDWKESKCGADLLVPEMTTAPYCFACFLNLWSISLGFDTWCFGMSKVEYFRETAQDAINTDESFHSTRLPTTSFMNVRLIYNLSLIA